MRDERSERRAPNRRTTENRPAKTTKNGVVVRAIAKGPAIANGPGRAATDVDRAAATDVADPGPGTVDAVPDLGPGTAEGATGPETGGASAQEEAARTKQDIIIIIINRRLPSLSTASNWRFEHLTSDNNND